MEHQEPFPEERIIRKAWDDFTDEDFAWLAQCGYHIAEHAREELNHQELITTSMIVVQGTEPERLRKQTEQLFANPETYGMVLRIKGFARGTDQTWYEVNCTPGTTVIQPRSVKRGILVVIGQSLKEEEIKRLFA